MMTAELPKPLATLHWRPFDDSKGPRLFQVVDSIAWHQSLKTERGSVRVYSEEQVLELLRPDGVPAVEAPPAPYRCIKPQCPTDCSMCNHAIPSDDTALVLIAELLDHFAVDGHGGPLEDGESAMADRARKFLAGARGVEGRKP